ncbi:hypothetical protein CLOSTHATH_02850 [Hungatella hathewayi DSM 13479]|uniref:Uncharacterized protein n=1 Tax=Hungatella hathewayi DSM 13479 TaxID=566550 RepID=D3AGW3_9FIRM|nr:hypothetical protein CLOSTHATH_02850 [Hungatella hathewayi DSM 13479]
MIPVKRAYQPFSFQRLDNRLLIGTAARKSGKQVSRKVAGQRYQFKKLIQLCIASG